MPDDAPSESGPQTVAVGRFDPIELPIILDVLREHGIFAMTKTPLEAVETEPYPMLAQGREILLVDRARAAEARRLIETEVRDLEAEMREGLEVAEVDFAEQGLVPLGFLEPPVARALLRALEETGIKAAPEYPLDGPPPPYARGDGRVRIHVEEPFLADAEALLEGEVLDALIAEGVSFAEPLREEAES